MYKYINSVKTLFLNPLQIIFPLPTISCSLQEYTLYKNNKFFSTFIKWKTKRDLINNTFVSKPVRKIIKKKSHQSLSNTIRILRLKNIFGNTVKYMFSLPLLRLPKKRPIISMDTKWWLTNISMAIIPSLLVIMICESYQDEIEIYYIQHQEKSGKNHQLGSKINNKCSGIKSRVMQKMNYPNEHKDNNVI